MSKNNNSCQSRKENAPRSTKLTETVTIPLTDYRHLLRVCTAFDIIVNSADSFGINRITFKAACNSLGIIFTEGEDA